MGVAIVATLGPGSIGTRGQKGPLLALSLTHTARSISLARAIGGTLAAGAPVLHSEEPLRPSRSLISFRPVLLAGQAFSRVARSLALARGFPPPPSLALLPGIHFRTVEPPVTITISSQAFQALRFVASMTRQAHYKVLERLLLAEARRLLKKKRE
jgi:hypothetical protein